MGRLPLQNGLGARLPQRVEVVIGHLVSNRGAEPSHVLLLKRRVPTQRCCRIPKVQHRSAAAAAVLGGIGCTLEEQWRMRKL